MTESADPARPETARPEIYVDADACPVRDETLRVAARHRLRVHLVSDGGIRPSQDPMVNVVFVTGGADAADDWIAERVGPRDLCVTADIPLAARCLEAGAQALRPTGKPFDQASIGMALAQRELMSTLRETGAVTGGPRPFSKADRSNFLNALETAVRAAMRR